MLAACAGNAVAPGATNNSYGTNTLNGASYSDAMAPDHAGKANDVKASKSHKLASHIPPVKPAPPKKTAAIPFVRVKVASLAKLDGKKVEAKLGKPEMQRGEGPAKVWQYRSDRCALDIFFYPQGKSKKPVLAHMLARLRNGEGKIGLQECLDEIVKSRVSHQG